MAPLCSEIDRHIESVRKDVLARQDCYIPMLRRIRLQGPLLAIYPSRIIIQITTFPYHGFLGQCTNPSEDDQAASDLPLCFDCTSRFEQ